MSLFFFSLFNVPSDADILGGVIENSYFSNSVCRSKSGRVRETSKIRFSSSFLL